MNRYKNILFLVAVLVIQIVGLASQIRRPNHAGTDAPSIRLIRLWAISLVSPPEKVVHGSGSGFHNLWSNYLDLRHVRRENLDLKDQLSRLQLEQAALMEDARQGQRLQGMLAFKEHYIYSTMPAQVIGTSGTDQSRILYIDKGSRDGLRPDMAVITPDGIVGKLKDVFGHTSQVLVISDQTSGAGVVLESTRLRGVLRGNALGQPQIVNTLPDERVKPGDKVITSGGDQIFPRGLPVGTVDQVVEDAVNPPYVDILIKPAANLGHLEELLVITEVSDQLPPKAQQDIARSIAAGELTATQQRASDVLAERLPGLSTSSALADSTQQQQFYANPDTAAVRLHPPPSLHPDHYSPNSTAPAGTLTPGQAIQDQHYAPTPESTPPPAAKAGAEDIGVEKTGGAEAKGAAHAKTSAATSASAGSPATAANPATATTPRPTPARPRIPKPKPAETEPAPPDTGNGAPQP